MKECPNCRELVGDSVEKCFNCKWDFVNPQENELARQKQREREAEQERLRIKREQEEEERAREEAKRAREEFKRAQERREKEKERIASFFASSTSTLDGFRIIKYIGIECGEVVIGTGLFAEFSASTADLFGTTSSTYASKLSIARKEAVKRLQEKCISIGADAVIGVDIDITTIGNNMIVVSANGTAVNIERIEE